MEAAEEDDCDCTHYHVVPYSPQTDPAAQVPVAQLTAKYRFLVGMADDHLGYIVPEPDVNRAVSQLTGIDGDHYEETNSASYRFGTMVYETWQALLAE